MFAGSKSRVKQKDAFQKPGHTPPAPTGGAGSLEGYHFFVATQRTRSRAKGGSLEGYPCKYRVHFLLRRDNERDNVLCFPLPAGEMKQWHRRGDECGTSGNSSRRRSMKQQRHPPSGGGAHIMLKYFSRFQNFVPVDGNEYHT